MGLSNSKDGTTDFKGLKIFAMGDMNNDKLNDIVTVSEDQKSFQPWFYNAESQKFSPAGTSVSVTAGHVITSVYIGKDLKKEHQRQQNLYVTVQSSEATQVKTYLPGLAGYEESATLTPIDI